MTRVLEIDSGNTCLKWRVRHGDRVERLQRAEQALVARWDQLPNIWREVDEARIVSVRTNAETARLVSLLSEAGIPVRLARSEKQLQGLHNGYHEPHALGVDRWMAMLAGWQYYQRGFCVVDAGTAITIDLVSDAGQHLGGFILPGMRLMQRALLGDTAGVRFDEELEARNQPGCTTAEAVQHGMELYLQGLQQQIAAHMHRANVTRLLLTGGDGKRLMAVCDEAEYKDELVLDGLKWI